MSVAPARGLRDEVWVGARRFKGTTWSLCRDLSACLRGKSTLTVVFHCVPVRGPLNRHGVAWTGCLRRRYSPCQDTGMPPALPPAAPSVVAHDSHSMGYPRMSHAIPPTLCRVTHSHRWNCNVCRHC